LEDRVVIAICAPKEPSKLTSKLIDAPILDKCRISLGDEHIRLH
jgi:hypothetical protein